MTDSLFVSLCKRGCPYFHTGSLVHRWQVIFGSALLHSMHFWLMARLTSYWFTFRISYYTYMYSAFGDVDWYPYYVSLHVCIPPLAMMTDHFPFYLLSYIPRYAILILLHVVIPLSYPCKIILFIIFAIICSLLWCLMCYIPMIILNTVLRILGIVTVGIWALVNHSSGI